MHFFARTIQRKLMLLMLLVGLVPAVAGVAYIYWGSVLSIDTAVGTYLQERAELAATALDQALQASFRAAEQWCDQSAGEGAPWEMGDPAPFESVLLVDRAGRTIHGIGANPPEQVTIRAALDRPDPISRIFLDETTSGSLRFVRQVSSEPSLFCVCQVSPNRLMHAFTPPHARGQASVDVFSNRGAFVARSTEDHRLSDFVSSNYAMIRNQLAGWSRAGTKNDSLLVGYATSRLLRLKQKEGATSVDWTVTVHMDLNDLSHLAGNFLWGYFFFTVLVAIGLIALSFHVSRVFLRPVQAMHRQITELAAGKPSTQLSLSARDELMELEQAFNAMAEHVASSRASLEQHLKTVETKANQIELVNQVTRGIVSAFDLEQLVRIIDSRLRELVRYDGLSVVLFGSDNSCEVTSTRDQFLDQHSSSLRAYLEERLLANQGTPVVAAPAQCGEDGIFEPGFARVCSAPLVIERGLIGALLLGTRALPAFSPDELAVIEQISPVLALAAEHIELYDRVQNFARELEKKVTERTEELKRAQDRLIQTERFAATGRLAAGIAHEINNPLGIIKNYLRLLGDKWKSSEQDLGEEVRVITEEIDRIARIVRSLLEFYRPIQKITSVDINAEIHSILRLMQPGLAKRMITVTANLDESLPRLELSQDHIRQVLLNLLRNAEDAMPSGGTLTIHTRRESRPEGDETIVLEVHDTGSGIRVEDLPHVFEPFFTTKATHGTGLGLTVTYGIVTTLGGTIDIESRSEQGTKLVVRIPMPKPAAKSIC